MSGIARRDFVRGAALGTAGIAGVAALGGLNAATEVQAAEPTPSLVMKPGVYCGYGRGFGPIIPVEVKIEVDETAIKSIEVINGDINHEEPVLMGTVVDYMIPRILEAQSLEVDGVCGATGASSGVKLAVEDALKKAIKAAGTPEDAISAFHAEVPKSPEEITLDYDIVVCGMGGAGSCAAMAAAEQLAANGAPVSVLAIETAGKYGGTAAIASEAFGVNPKQLAELYNDGNDFCDYDSLYEDWLQVYGVGNPCKPEVVKLIMDESGPTVDWLQFQHGFMFSFPKKGFGDCVWCVKCQYVNRGRENDGAGIKYSDYSPNPDYKWDDRFNSVIQYYDQIAADFTALGGEYLVETTCTELLYDDAGKKVTGVKAVNNVTGDVYTVNAKAVILATGGFGGSADVSEQLMEGSVFPSKGQWYIIGCQQNKGQILKSAADQGVGLYNSTMPPIIHNRTTAIQLTGFPIYFHDGVDGVDYRQATWTLNDLPLIIGTNTGHLAVSSADGVRHANEAGDFYMFNGVSYWTILGSEVLDDLAANGLPGEPGTYVSGGRYTGQGGYPAGRPIPEIYEVMDYAFDKGLVCKADTLEELAAQMGVPAEDFVAQVERYRGYCQSGVDEEFGKAAEKLVDDLAKPPFYAIDMRDAPYATCACLDVDDKVNCLAADGTPIAGLYACGNDSGGVLYSDSMPYSQYGGVALGWALTSGRVAGINAADFVSA